MFWQNLNESFNCMFNNFHNLEEIIFLKKYFFFWWFFPMFDNIFLNNLALKRLRRRYESTGPYETTFSRSMAKFL